MTQIAAFALGYTAILAVPGPNVLAVGTLAALRGFRAGLPMAIGAAVGATALACVTSWTTEILAHWRGCMSIVGATLLAIVAWRIARMRPLPASAYRQLRSSPIEFLSGAATALTNPITAAYFIASFAGLSLTGQPHTPGVVILAVPLISAAFYVGALAVFASATVRRVALAWHTPIRLSAALVLMLPAAWMLYDLAG